MILILTVGLEVKKQPDIMFGSVAHGGFLVLQCPMVDFIYCPCIIWNRFQNEHFEEFPNVARL